MDDMTLTRALHSKLKETCPLSEKLDAVTKLVKSTKFNLSTKNEIFINWLFECIGNQSRNPTFDESVQLWSTLEEMLKIDISNQVILLKAGVTKILTTALRNYSFKSVPVHIFSCVITFLQHSSVNSVIISNGDLLFTLLFAVLDVICKMPVNDCGANASIASAQLLIMKILDVLDNLPFSTDDSKIPTFTNALQEIASFSYVASTKIYFCHSNHRIIQKLCSIIFSTKTKPYESLLVLSDEIENLTTPNKDLVNFFLQLQRLLQVEEDVYNGIPGGAACAALLKYILSEVFIQNKSGLEPLKVLALLCSISGLDIPLLVTADSCCIDCLKVESGMKLVGLARLLEACTNHPQYFSSTSAPERHLKPSDWLNGITAVLLDVKFTKHKCALLKCFRFLLKISVSVIENNIISVIKLCLLTINVDSIDLEKECCDLFKDLLSLHSRLHQLPKFFVKLLLALTECIKENSSGKHILRGQIFPVVLESLILHFQELPFGQVIKLWAIFSETYTTFVNMSQIFPAGKGAILFIAQLFSSFLLHSKLYDDAIPDNVSTKFVDLIHHTADEMMKNSYILANSDEAQLPQQSFLMLCYALGELELCSSNNNESSSETLTLKFPDNPLDCSLLLNFLDEQHTKVFEMFLKSEDKVISFLVYLLLIQKIRGLIQKTVSNEEEQHLQKAISTVLCHARENIHMHNSWNLDICTLDKTNYGSAIWRVLLKYFPLMLNRMNGKELILICSCFKDIVLQESSSENSSEMDLKSIMLTELQSPHFQNSMMFQSAFTASLWKFDPAFLIKKRSMDEMESGNTFWNVLSQLSVYRSKWIKYAVSTPKSNDGEFNSLWENLKTACDSLNEILQSESAVKIKLRNKVYSTLNLIECLPLEYLFPGNQLRCIIGLSIFLFLTPESFKTDEAVVIAKQISKQFIAIFEGPRSIWLFDLVSSGPYLRAVVNTLERLMNNKQDESYEWCKMLLDPLISLIAINVQTLSAAEDYFSECFSEKQVSPISSLTLLLMLRKLSQILKKVHVHPQQKEVYERLAISICYCCAKFLKKYEGSCEDSAFSTLIQCYTEVIELVSLPFWSAEQKKKDRCLAQLPNVLKIARENISDKRNNKVYFNLFAKVLKHTDILKDCIPVNLHTEIWENIQLQHLSVIENELSDREPHSFTDDEIELIQSVLNVLPEEKINSILEDILIEMNCQDLDQLNLYRLQRNLNTVKQVIESDLKKEETSFSASLLPKIMLQLNSIVNRANQSELHLKKLKLPVLDFISFLVQQKKRGIPRQNVIQSLHFCVVVRLQDMIGDLPNFIITFDAVWNIVYNLLIHHVPYVLSAGAPFLSVVTNLLKSIVLAGSQDALSVTDSTAQTRMTSCAQNMERLLSLISRHPKFSKLAPYLIADYVDSVQHITLESSIKNHLLSGLNRILDLCSENLLKMIAVNINHSCRDIYSNIVRNYQQDRYRGGV